MTPLGGQHIVTGLVGASCVEDVPRWLQCSSSDVSVSFYNVTDLILGIGWLNGPYGGPDVRNP